jgi:PPM family protein phosphatase
MLRISEQYSGTDTGRQRRANEDSFLARSPLFVVADGMGGAQAGEVASRTAVDTFRQGLDEGAGPDPEGSLLSRAQEANARIHELSQSNAEQAGMGTTLTVVYVGEEEVSVAHVGDSRAYCLRDGELLRLTDDHSLVDELMRQGKLTPEEAEEHPQRSIITRALGPEPDVEIDTSSYRARDGDIYLLCSDGLTTMVSEAQVAQILLQNPRLADAGEALLRAANEAGGRDNITAILFRLEEVHSTSYTDTAQQQSTMTGLAAVNQADSASDTHPETMGATAPTRTPGSVTARRPRRPQPARVSTGAPARRLRRAAVLVTVLVVLGFLVTGAYLAIQSVYFIGTNSRGLVTVFSGLPYELPGHVKLYSQYYVSGVPAAGIPEPRRRALLDHSLRAQGDATDLVRSLELGQLGGASPAQ